MESKKFLNADEVVAEFGLDEAALKQFVDAGEVRALADRGTWKYRRDELQALADAGKFQPPSLSDGDQMMTFQHPDQPDDDVSYIELDEEALAEHATMEPPASQPAAAHETVDDWFDPSDAAEMTAPREQSSSDVAIYPGTAAESAQSDDGPSIAADSDSDVRLASEYDFEAPRPEDSGILLDFNLDAGATVSSSGSSLRLPQTAPGAVDDVVPAETDDSAWDEISETSATGDSSVVGIAGGASGIRLGGDSDVGGSSLQMGGDSAVHLGGDSAVQLGRPDESGILLDDASHLGMTGESSVLAGAVSNIVDDSGITIEEDSGITLEGTPGAAAENNDSGITLEDNAGAATDDDDSGISLSAGDSGISLGTFDSGLSLEGAADSGIAVDGNAPTMADDDLQMDLLGDQTQMLDLSNEFNEDSAFEINLDDGDATAELLLGDDDDADDSSATVIRKGRPQAGSLSAAFDLDDVAEVEDLEISQDLEAGVEEEIEELSDDEEVFDASDETFGGDEVEATEDEDYLEPEAKSKKPTGPREPAWGAGMAVGLVACALFLAANTLILWAGVSTMWDGKDAEGPAASLIQTLGDMIK